MHTASHLVLLSALTAVTAFANNWPKWRGPEGNGVSSEKNLPLKWSDKDNVRWRVELPGPGNSSPIVWGERVFVAQAIKAENRRALICFDLASGKQLWQSGMTYTDPESTQESNPYCAGTPATDGERVYVSFGSPGVYAYDFSGKEIWHRDLGKLNHMFGTAVSPVIQGELCIVNQGPGEKARLIALNRKTGETVWEAEPPKPDATEEQQAMAGGGGRGGFGPGPMLASQLLTQGDKNGDHLLSKPELSALADAWFDKLDAEKEGKLSRDQFTAKFGELLPPPPEGGGGGQRGGRGGGPARFIAPGLFTAADTDKDGSLTRAELKGTFEKWATDWDTDKSGSLNESKLRDGLTAALPTPNFGGPGGPGGPGGRGGGGGPGGRGGGGGAGGSWSTPIVAQANGRDELIAGFPFRLVGFDPKTGKQLWFSKGLGGSIYTTPLWGDGKLVASSGGPAGGNAIAVKPGGSGDVTESQRVWRLDRVKSAFGTGVIHDGYLYTIGQEGIVECSDLATGKSVWQERLSGPGKQTSTWSSMLLSEGKIYIPNKSGDVFVLRAGPKFELLATNSIGEPTNASLAASNNKLLLRTAKALWCFEDSAATR